MKATLTVLPGDGVGPEVTAEAIRVLAAVGSRFDHTFATTEALIGGAAIDATGSALPPETVEACRAADAVLLGAVGGPQWDRPGAAVRPEQGLLGIRRELGLFANLRPVTTHPRLVAASPIRPERLAGVDLMVVRELTGGIYFGEKGRKPAPDGHGEVAYDVCSYSTQEIERIARVAGSLARARNGRVTSVDKANVIETSRLWREVVTRVFADEFADITLDHMLVDAAAMHLIRKPSQFDVILTENMFGDILTDEASMLAGSIGALPSASLGAPRGTGARGLYEPIHGSAPDIAGRGVANPIGTILSVALMLRYSLGLEAEASAVERAVSAVLDAGCVTADLVLDDEAAMSTSQVGAAIAEAVASGPQAVHSSAAAKGGAA